MNLTRLSLATFILAMGVNSIWAQGDFFFTFQKGESNSDQEAFFQLGDSGSLWIYWSTNGPADSDLNVGAFIDIFTSESGIIEFTAAETFDFELTVGNQTVGNRLLDENGQGGLIGPPLDLAANFIDELAAFTVTGGPGILEANNGSGVFLDNGYDAENDGFLWGRVDFDVIALGMTEVTGAAGEGMIVHNGQTVPAAFTTATIRVPAFVPEPTSGGLIAIGMFGLFACRRR